MNTVCLNFELFCKTNALGTFRFGQLLMFSSMHKHVKWAYGHAYCFYKDLADKL